MNDNFLRDAQVRSYEIEISRAIGNESDIGDAIRAVNSAFGSSLPEAEVAAIVAREIYKAQLYSGMQLRHRHVPPNDVPLARVRTLPIGWIIAGVVFVAVILAIRSAGRRSRVEPAPAPMGW
jgi:hypothetical protein